MKRIYALIVMLLAAIPCRAQIDIATLDGKTPDEVIKMFGTPVDQDRENYYGLFLKEWGKYYFTIAKGKISKIEFISTTLSNLL